MVFVPDGAKIAPDHLLNNTIARMITYAGPQTPTWLTPTAQNAEVYQHLQWLIQQKHIKSLVLLKQQLPDKTSRS